MKKSVIRQMFDGERGRQELIKFTDEYFKLQEDVNKNDDEIRAQLAISPALLELYEKTIESIEDMYCESIDTYYIEGFKFGVLMGMEIAKDNN